MQAREANPDGPTRSYFGFGTVLDPPAFEEWRAQHGYEFFSLPAGEVAEALDVDLVFDFPSRWWGGRVAGLADRAGKSVFGRLFTIPGKDWPILQHKEGAVTGMCIERSVRVKTANGEVLATTFTTNPARQSLEGPLSSRFLEALLRGGTAAGLPPDYLERVRQSGSTSL